MMADFLPQQHWPFLLSLLPEIKIPPQIGQTKKDLELPVLLPLKFNLLPSFHLETNKYIESHLNSTKINIKKLNLVLLKIKMLVFLMTSNKLNKTS